MHTVGSVPKAEELVDRLMSIALQDGPTKAYATWQERKPGRLTLEGAFEQLAARDRVSGSQRGGRRGMPHAPKTRKIYADAAQRILAYFGADRPAADLGHHPEMIEAFAAQLLETLAPNTARSVLSYLKKLGHRLVTTGALPGPFLIPSIADDRGEPEAITESQYLLIRENIRSAQTRHIWDVLWYTGWRLSEALQLLVEDVDLVGRSAVLRMTKTAKREEVALPPPAVAILKKQIRRARQRRSPWVFPGRDDRTKHQADPARQLRHAGKRAGVYIVDPRTQERRTPTSHIVGRHSWATSMAESGATEIELMVGGRWSKPAMIRRYVKADQQFKQRIADRVTELPEPSAQKVASFAAGRKGRKG